MTDVNFALNPPGTLIMRALGAQPYLLVTMAASETEEGELDITVETGGHVPQTLEAVRHIVSMLDMFLTEAEQSGQEPVEVAIDEEVSDG